MDGRRLFSEYCPPNAGGRKDKRINSREALDTRSMLASEYLSPRVAGNPDCVVYSPCSPYKPLVENPSQSL